jgi:predicted ATPase
VYCEGTNDCLQTAYRASTYCKQLSQAPKSKKKVIGYSSGDIRFNYEAELHRLTGQLLLARSGAHHTEAETCFRQALTVAHRQEAKALELRAALSLARLWQQQGKRAEARELVAPVYGWFTEGFDTADLHEAKALLDALA